MAKSPTTHYPPLWAPTKRHAMRRANECGTFGRLTRGLNRASLERVGDPSDNAGRAMLKRAGLYRAGETPSCGPTSEEGLYYFDSMLDTSTDGLARMENWGDQWPNEWDVQPVDDNGVPVGVGQWPVVVPGAGLNGEPVVRCSWAAGTFNGSVLQHIFPVGTLNKPTADGVPMSGFAIVKPRSILGGWIATHRLTTPDLEFCLRRKDASNQIAIGTNTDFNAGYISPVVDYTNQVLVVEWNFYGAGLPTPASVSVNGTALAFLAGSLATLQPYTGKSGFSIGYNNATFQSFDGDISAVFAYLGTDVSHPARAAAARAWCNERAFG